MTLGTVTKGVLCIGSALPDPPFELLQANEPCGFDIELTRVIAAELGLAWRLEPYAGADFNGIFGGLASGSYDCVASGATITPEREKLASFCTFYLRSGQSLVCNIEATPHVKSIDDLKGMILGVQHGNTSEPVAHRLKAEGLIAEVRPYAYRDIGLMLDDLSAGKIGGVMKLAPVMRWMIKDRPGLRLVQESITDETLGVAVRLGDRALRDAINKAQTRLQESGALQRLKQKWLLT